MKTKKRYTRSEKSRLRKLRIRARNRLQSKLAEVWSIYKFLPQCKEWDIPIQEKRIEFCKELIGPSTYKHIDTLNYEQLIRAINNVDNSFYQFKSQYRRQIFVRNNWLILFSTLIALTAIVLVYHHE